MDNNHFNAVDNLGSVDRKGIKLGFKDLRSAIVNVSLSGHDYFKPVDYGHRRIICDFHQFQQMYAVEINVFPLPDDTFVILNEFNQVPILTNAFLHGNYIAIVTCGIRDQRHTTGLICSLMGYADYGNHAERLIFLRGLYLAEVDLIKKVTHTTHYYYNLYTANARIKNHISNYYIGSQFDPPSLRRVNIQESNIIYSCSAIPSIVTKNFIEKNYINDIRDRMRILFSRFNTGVPEDSLNYVIYILRWLPISCTQKFEIIDHEHVMNMLILLDKYIDKKNRIKCYCCSAVLAGLCDVLFKPSLVEHIHSNDDGEIYDLIFLKNTFNTIYDDVAEFDDAWFKNFGWSLVNCAKCTQQLGWRYSTLLVDQDTPFFALSRDSIILEAHDSDEEHGQPHFNALDRTVGDILEQNRSIVTADNEDYDYEEETSENIGNTEEYIENYMIVEDD